jgi:penicillin amidase
MESCTGAGQNLNFVEGDPAAIAQSLTISRDHFGVPHISGPTDAHVVFGLAYARAEDHFSLIEDAVIEALGRQAEVKGESAVRDDYLVRAFRIPQLAQAEYRHLAPKIRVLADAYAAGLNFFLQTHPEEKPKRIDRFEPWHFLAVYRTSWDGMARGQAGLEGEDVAAYIRNLREKSRIGSNAWAISPRRSGNGKTYLVLNPHIPFDEPYEAHLKSGEGWNFYGELAYGENIIPVLGHNDDLAWSLTMNYPDIADAFTMIFDHPSDSLLYRYGQGYRRAEYWKDTILIRTAEGMKSRVFSFRRTIHGPLLGQVRDTGISYRLAPYEKGGLLEQFYRMSKAGSLAEFREALEIQALPAMNIMYADRYGNIFYIYDGMIPVRNEGLDWDRPVDGSVPENGWKGFHPVGELPQLLNPVSGYLQNCNSDPFHTTSSGNPAPAGFPRYMVAHESENARSERSRQLLDTLQEFSLESLGRAIMDTYVHDADRWLPLLFEEFGRLGRENRQQADPLREAVDSLRSWDRRAHVDSRAASLYFIFAEIVRHETFTRIFGTPSPEISSRWPYTTYLEQAVRLLENDKGTWKVPWGVINRHQRLPDNGRHLVNPGVHSLPLPGGNSVTGILFCAYRDPVLLDSIVTRRADAGHSYVSVVELGDTVRARSVLPYGISRDPESPHYFDQAPLFVQGRFKDVLWHDEEIEKYLEARYHPGERSR